MPPQVTGVLDRIVQIAVAILLAFNGWIAITLISHEVDIASISASRFTAQDGTDMLKIISTNNVSVLNELNAIRVLMNEPQSWLVDRVLVLEVEVKELRKEFGGK